MKYGDVLVDLQRLQAQIEAFEKEPVQKGLILFYGDSGFTRWKPQYGQNRMEDDLPGKNGRQAVVNHGFGSSTAEEQLYYYDRAVRPWAPRALVLRAFGNDAGAGYSAREILFLQARMMDHARADFPGIRLYICNISPQLRHREVPQKRHDMMAEYNGLLERYCAEHDDTTLLDLKNWAPFYTDPAHAGDLAFLREDIYVEDKGHFNTVGYDLFRRFFLEKLDDIL